MAALAKVTRLIDTHKAKAAFLAPFISFMGAVAVNWIATGEFDEMELRGVIAGTVGSVIAALATYITSAGAAEVIVEPGSLELPDDAVVHEDLIGGAVAPVTPREPPQDLVVREGVGGDTWEVPDEEELALEGEAELPLEDSDALIEYSTVEDPEVEDDLLDAELPSDEVEAASPPPLADQELLDEPGEPNVRMPSQDHAIDAAQENDQ